MESILQGCPQNYLTSPCAQSCKSRHHRHYGKEALSWHKKRNTGMLRQSNEGTHKLHLFKSYLKSFLPRNKHGKGHFILKIKTK